MAPEPSPPAAAPPLLIDFPAAVVRWAEVFGREAPVELEVGPGKGLFLVNAASRRPGHDFLGMGVARKSAGGAAGGAGRGGLTTARLVAGDARAFLSRHTPPGSLAAVHVYFPDPWWKKRHRK